ncbi:MAG: DsbA family protein [Pseudomonadota bacterium]|nr:DsbA family protein [Pseudomonadota bacterium]
MSIRTPARLLAAGLLLAASAAIADEATDQAILRQLTAMQEDLRRLHGEVAQLRQAVTEIHRAALQPPAAPPPPPAPVTVELGDSPALGNADAPLGLVEFSDYQCPFCYRFHAQTFPQLKEKYIDTGKVRYVLRNYPLGFHPEAEGAALAAACAGEQDAYWPMKDALFANQRRLGPALYPELAAELNLDPARFAACLADPQRRQAVQADLAYGEQVGVTGTPSFFVGRIENNRLVDARRITGAQPLAAFERAIDALASP